MKSSVTTIIIIIALLTLTSCIKYKSRPFVNLEKPFIPDNAVNVSLRPTFGVHKTLFINCQPSYIIFCDTVNPPVTEVANSTQQISYIISNESVKLKPNTKYYWLCRADCDAYVFPSDIFSFTTIDTSILNGSRWNFMYAIKKSDYEHQHPANFRNLDIPKDSSLSYDEPYKFSIMNDSVINVARFGVKDELPDRGIFSFSFDNVQILDWNYRFVNLGINIHGEKSKYTNVITLVLKESDSDNIIVFSRNE